MRSGQDESTIIKGRGGFTLSEMMVTIMIMIVVFFALFSIFDMSLRVFSYGNNKVEAMESARLGMEKMEREIRQAYKYNSAASPPQNHLFFDTASSDNPADRCLPLPVQIYLRQRDGRTGAANG